MAVRIENIAMSDDEMTIDTTEEYTTPPLAAERLEQLRDELAEDTIERLMTSDRPVKKFRVNAINVFLTYSQCPLPKEEVVELLTDLWPDLEHLIVAHELHKDGSHHIHAQARFMKKKDFRSPTFADLVGYDDQNNEVIYHGNYQASKSAKAVARYCTKESEYVLWGISQDDFDRIRGKRNVFAEALHAPTAKKATKLIRGGAPRDWFLSGKRIMEMIDHQFCQDRFKVYKPIFDPVLPCKPTDAMNDWILSWKTSRTKCLCLLGGAELGKTHWARSIVQPHVYWKSYIDIVMWNPEAKLLIIDDIDFEFLPSPKTYLTQAGDSVVTDKYRRKTNICVNMPAIYISNDMPRTKAGLPLSVDDYWSKVMIFITVHEPLF